MSENDNSDIVHPPETASAGAHVCNMEQYHELYERSASDPEGFWAEVAEGFHWYKKWDSVRSYNYDMNTGPIDLRWFEGGRTNVCYNCVDRHLEPRGDKIAVIWEGNEPGEDATLTYRQLHEQVCRFANVLKSRGVNK